MTPLHTFVFADLAGFTATTEAHGDDHAADIAEAFVDAMRGLLPGHEAREVKTMGDAVMLHVADAERALCLAECAVGELGARHGELGVRVGMHTGPAVHRHGDWFEATVAEEHHQQRESGRRDQRRADALDRRRRDLQADRVGQTGGQRTAGEDRPAGGEHALGAEEVRKTAAEQQQAAERDGVGVEDP